jgi:hypothetical protein
VPARGLPAEQGGNELLVAVAIVLVVYLIT